MHLPDLLRALIAVLAVRLLSTKLLAHSRPDCWEAAQSFGPEGGWTNGKLLVGVARRRGCW